MLHVHVQSFLKRQLWCVCMLNFLDFDLSKSMFKFVNADMTPKKSASEATAQFFLELFDFFQIHLLMYNTISHSFTAYLALKLLSNCKLELHFWLNLETHKKYEVTCMCAMDHKLCLLVFCRQFLFRLSVSMQ